MPSHHGAEQSSRTPARADGSVVMSDDDISIQTQEEYRWFESLRAREFVHTRIYNMNLLERTRMDVELSDTFSAIRWSKLYEEPHPGLRFLTLEFLMILTTSTRYQKPMVRFRLFARQYEVSLLRLGKLMDFSCSLDPRA